MTSQPAAGDLQINNDNDLELTVELAWHQWQSSRRDTKTSKENKQELLLFVKLFIVLTGQRAFSSYDTEVRLTTTRLLPPHRPTCLVVLTCLPHSMCLFCDGAPPWPCSAAWPRFLARLSCNCRNHSSSLSGLQSPSVPLSISIHTWTKS